MSKDNQLPVELLTNIFVEVRRGNPETYIDMFKSCRQACKLFDEVILTNLFKTGVDTGFGCVSQPCCYLHRDAVSSALQRYPHLTKYIRTLFFGLGDCYDPSQITQRKVPHASINHPILSIRSPLLQLSNVTTLVVSTSRPFLPAILHGLQTLPTDLRAVLRRYLSTSTLTTLSLSWVRDVPISDILFLTSLVNVEFYSCTFIRLPQSTLHKESSLVNLCVIDYVDTEFPIFVVAHLARIEKVKVILLSDKIHVIDPISYDLDPLEVTSNPAISHTFQYLSEIIADNLNDWNIFLQDRTINPFPALTKLSCGVTMGEQALANIALLDHYKSLKELGLMNIGTLVLEVPGDFFDSDQSDLHLGDHLTKCTKTLTNLTLDWGLTFYSYPTNFGYPLDQIIDAFKRISGDNIIQSIKLSNRLEIPCERGPFRPRPDIANFEALSEVLCQPGAFSQLTSVALHTGVLIHADKFKSEKETEALLLRVLEPALQHFRAAQIGFSLTTNYYRGVCSTDCEHDSDSENSYDIG